MWKKFQKNVGLQILYALLCWNTAKSKKVISNQTNSKFPKFVKSGKVCFTGQIIYSACNELNMLSYLCQRKYQWQVFRKKSFPYGCWFFLVYTNLVEVNTRLIVWWTSAMVYQRLVILIFFSMFTALLENCFREWILRFD